MSETPKERVVRQLLELATNSRAIAANALANARDYEQRAQEMQKEARDGRTHDAD